MQSAYPTADASQTDPHAEPEMRWVMDFILGVRQIRGEMDIARSRRLDVVLQNASATDLDYARRNRAILLFDSAYEAYIRDPEIPRSIYEIPGARDVAIEFRSFSKTAGFTGVRCAYTVVPRSLKAWDASGREHALHPLWNRRHTTKFNGTAYIVQKAAAAVYTEAGRRQARKLTDFYLSNAQLIRSAMAKLGLPCSGGENAPYLWVNTGHDSWEFFDLLLTKAQVVCTPGVGFGRCGQGHVRISAFNSRENVVTALDRISAALA